MLNLEAPDSCHFLRFLTTMNISALYTATLMDGRIGQHLCYQHKIGNRKLLGALAHECVGDKSKLNTHRFQCVAHRLTTLVEARLDHLRKKFLVTFQGFYTIAPQSDDCRFDFRWRGEKIFVDREEIFYIVER